MSAKKKKVVKKKASEKKTAKKKVAKKKVVTVAKPALTEKAINRLIDSNLQLQHKMIDVVLGVKELNQNVSSLVHIFKSAGDHIKSGKYEDPMINKINDLLDQNRNLQKALSMLEKYVHDKNMKPRPLESI